VLHVARHLGDGETHVDHVERDRDLETRTARERERCLERLTRQASHTAEGLKRAPSGQRSDRLARRTRRRAWRPDGVVGKRNRHVGNVLKHRRHDGCRAGGPVAKAWFHEENGARHSTLLVPHRDHGGTGLDRDRASAPMRMAHHDGARVAREVLGVVERSVIDHEDQVDPRYRPARAHGRRDAASLVMRDDQGRGKRLRGRRGAASSGSGLCPARGRTSRRTRFGRCSAGRSLGIVVSHTPSLASPRPER